MSKYKINELADEISIRENNPKNSDYDKFVGLEHYDSGNILIYRYGTTEKLDSAMKVFKSDDILIARRNVYLKRASMVKFDGLTSGDSIVLRARNESIKRLLPFVFNTEQFWNYAISHADGSMSKRLSPALLMEYETNLPDNDKDRDKLADVLWSINDTLDSYKEQLRLCDELVKAQFVEMFTKTPKKELNAISLEWFKGQPFKKDEIVEDGHNKCIHYGELFTKYGPIIKEIYSLTNSEIIEKKKSKKGDILFPASDVTPIGLSRCSVILENNVILGGDIIVLRPKEEINPIYLSYAINQQKKQLISRVTGSIVRHMSSKSLQSVLIPIPSIEKQNKFVNFVQHLDKSKVALKDSIESLNKIYTNIINTNLG